MYTQKVREFCLACENEQNKLPTKPIFLSPEKVNFITQMVNDELEELKVAKTIGEQADALVDAIYYICNTAVKQGINLDNIFNIVHEANMSKIVNGKVLRRQDGKILKPDGWKDPQQFIDEEIKYQKQNGSFQNTNLNNK